MFNRPTFKYALLMGDVACLSLAYFVVLDVVLLGDVTEVFASPANAGLVLAIYALSLPLFLFTCLLNNLYELRVLRSHSRHLLRICKSLFIGTGIVLFMMLLIGRDFLLAYGSDLLASFLIIAFVLVAAVRLVIVYTLISRRANTKRKRRLLIVGGDEAARKVVAAIQNEPGSILDIVGIVDDYKEPGVPLFDGWVNLGGLDSIPELAKTQRADEILIAIDSAPYSRLVKVIEAGISTGCDVRVLSDRLNALASRIGAEQYIRDIQVVTFIHTRPVAPGLNVRRIVDAAIAAVALVILSPLFLAVCLGIKLSSPGPVIFSQTRIGRNGRAFNFYKFRSMHEGAPSELHRDYVRSFIKGEAKGDSHDERSGEIFKIADDPRTFPFGRFIRRTSIDELPQLINVLRGDMSLISPRPCLPYEWDSYEEWHKQRLSVVPGCTGLWQVYGRSAVTFEEMVIMDLYYICHRSFTLDARILYKTISVIFLAKGGF